MAATAVEVKKTEPSAPVPAPVPASAPVRMPELWRSFHDEMERMFDRLLGGGFAMPSLRRLFDFEPMRRIERTLTIAMPAIDVAENETAYKIIAELPGIEANDVDVTVSGDTVTIKGEKRQEKKKAITCASAPSAPSSAHFRSRKGSIATRSAPNSRKGF